MTLASVTGGSASSVRSSAEILEDVADLDDAERQRFVDAIARETRGLTEVTRGLVGQFEVDAKARRLTPMHELDDLIFDNDNYFPRLEQVAADLRGAIEAEGPFGEATLVTVLGRRFGITVRRSATREVDAIGFPGQYHYDATARSMWFQTSAVAATRQFQLTRLFAELVASAAIGMGFGAARPGTAGFMAGRRGGGTLHGLEQDRCIGRHRLRQHGEQRDGGAEPPHRRGMPRGL